jgi:hypothetical protein
MPQAIQIEIQDEQHQSCSMCCVRWFFWWHAPALLAWPPVRIHTKERWQLLSDSKTLTVKSDVDFPDAPGMPSSVVAEAVWNSEIHKS